ncbi:MAG: ATPase, T2SS/T4P/T4SS family [Candidatus Aenigmatarchaeota archaeon]
MVDENTVSDESSKNTAPSVAVIPNIEKPIEEKREARVEKEEKKYEKTHKTARLEPKIVKKWLNDVGWSANPFTFRITPSISVGYSEQRDEILSLLEEKHKIILVTGPTGSGKTTLLKWVSNNLPLGYEHIYIAKPPYKPDEFVRIFKEKFRISWFLRPFNPNIKNTYDISGFLNKKLRNKYLIIMFDESHEADIDILEWLRVLSDQVENMSIILSGLPIFEDHIKDKLETLRKRIVARIELLSLTKEETFELIRKRIASVGGNDIEPFLPETIDMIYERTGGFPREVLRLSNELVNLAIKEERRRITPDLLREDIEEKPTTMKILDRLTNMQKEVINFLSKKSLSPGDIADMLDLEKYKSRQHAVRSLNNVLKILLQENLVEREKRDKTFIYRLSPRIKTLVVKS